MSALDKLVNPCNWDIDESYDAEGNRDVEIHYIGDLDLERAAAELAALRARIERLEKALEHIRDYGNYVTDGDVRDETGIILHVSDFAAAALEE